MEVCGGGDAEAEGAACEGGLEEASEVELFEDGRGKASEEEVGGFEGEGWVGLEGLDGGLGGRDVMEALGPEEFDEVLADHEDGVDDEEGEEAEEDAFWELAWVETEGGDTAFDGLMDEEESEERGGELGEGVEGLGDDGVGEVCGGECGGVGSGCGGGAWGAAGGGGGGGACEGLCDGSGGGFGRGGDGGGGGGGDEGAEGGGFWRGLLWSEGVECDEGGGRGAYVY